MTDLLLPWAPFFYSFGPSLYVIRVVADWWKLRLYLPLTQAQRALSSPSVKITPPPSDETLTELKNRYSTMNLDSLTQELNQITETASTNPEVQTMIESNFKSKAQQKIHVHHFIFGIPSMFISWALFVVAQNWWALIVAGVTSALFLSELKELITQQWQP